MSNPVLRAHRDEDGGTVHGMLDGAQWSATYNNDSQLSVGPETGKFTDLDGAEWPASQLGSAAIRAVRYVDWHQRIEKLPPLTSGRPLTSTSVPLQPDPTYFREQRRSATQGSGRNGERRDRWYCRHLGWLQEYTDTDLELREPEEQEVGGAAEWGSASVTWTNDIPDTRDGTAAPDGAGVGAKQRLRITVPNVYTKLTLGEAYRNQDAQGFAYPGFGAETDGHVFVHAQKTVGVQSEESTCIQSQINTAIGGKASLVAGSQGGVIMAGGGGVTILGGAPKSWPANDASDGTDPKEPKWVAPINEASAWVTAIASAVDAGIGLVSAVSSAKDTLLGLKSPKLGVLNATLWGGGVAGVLASSIGAAGGVASLAGWNSPTLGQLGTLAAGTLIYGNAGWIGATPVTMGLYSGAGTTIASIAGVAISAVKSIEISALQEVKVSAPKGTVEISSGKKVSMVGELEAEVAARSGGLALKGKDIAVGSGSGGGKQSETTSVAVVAKDLVGLASQDHMRLSAKNFGISAENTAINGKKIEIGGQGAKAGITGEEISVSGNKYVSLGTPGFFLTVGDSELSLGNIKKAPPPPPTRKPPDMKARLALLASDTPFADLRQLKADEEKAWIDEQMAWLDKVGELEHKNCSITLKDGDISLEVHGFKFKIDSTATAISNTMKIMK